MQTNRLDVDCIKVVLASGRSISGLGRSIGWLVVHRLLVGAHVVDVVVVFSVAAVLVRPLQLKVEERLNVQQFFNTFQSHLGLEGVVLLAEVLLPVVMGVAPPVPPLKSLVRGHVDVLEVVVAGVAAVRAWSGDGQ